MKLDKKQATLKGIGEVMVHYDYTPCVQEYDVVEVYKDGVNITHLLSQEAIDLIALDLYESNADWHENIRSCEYLERNA